MPKRATPGTNRSKDPKTDPRLHQVVCELLSEAVSSADVATTLEVRGRCMEPLIRDGDRVSIRSSKARPEIGDVVLADSPLTGLVCHRVLRVNETSLLLAGDRSSRLEEHAPETLIGIVDSVRRNGKMVTLAASPARFYDRWQARLHLWTCGRRSILARAAERLRRAFLLWRSRVWVHAQDC